MLDSTANRALRFAQYLAAGLFVSSTWACTVATSPDDAASASESQDSTDRDYSGELPRIAPLEPDEALNSFEVETGFRIESAAAEPLVVDPVAMSFDEDGRLYVVEMRGYSENPRELLGRVRLLEDTDDDGRFDTSHVFLDRLSWPTAVIAYDGGAFVGVAPDILYARDEDGDFRADLREKVFTGFSRGNVQGLVNSFQWGLDNRIHGATSTSGGVLRAASAGEDDAIDFRGRDFAFDPRTRRLEATSGGAQHGMSFDDWGRKFASSNSDHIQAVMFEDRYVARNPFLAAPSARVSIAADGPQAEVFRISPVEPWRVVRTRLRVKGLVKGPVEGGGRAAGYFTGATGVTIYRGDAWPEPFRSSAIIGDVGSNIVHRKILETRGVEPVAKRAELKREFVASRDIWFRPAQFANGPDGALYVLDVYREVIEHPDSLPPVIKRHLDLTSGRERGRIYRIVPADFRRRKTEPFSEKTTVQLVELLGHHNGWHRDTAARLLYQRRDRAAVRPLRDFVFQSDEPLARMHALYALEGLDSLDADVLIHALDDSSARVREHAVRLAERQADGVPAIRARLVEMVDDGDARVRLQLAFSLGEVAGGERIAALAALAARDGEDRWMRLALQSSLADDAAQMFERLASDAEFRRRGAASVFLESLARQIGAQNRESDVASALAAIESLTESDSNMARRLMQNLSQGLADAGNPLRSRVASGRITELVESMVSESRAKALDANLNLADRTEAVRLLGLDSYDRAAPTLKKLIDHRQPQELQLAAIGALSRFTDATVADTLIEAWPSLSPRLRTAAVEALCARSERIAPLLASLADGRISRGDVDPARIKLLTNHSDGSIRRKAEELLAEISVGRRQEIVERYRDALELDGDPQRGRDVFRKTCAACHRLEGFGHELAPALAAFQNRGPEAILLNVLDPNREVNPQYVNYQLITTDGRAMTGVIAAESATSVTLKRADGEQDTVLRINIDEIHSTGMSLMPEGLEKDLEPQNMADLIAYLLSVES